MWSVECVYSSAVRDISLYSHFNRASHFCFQILPTSPHFWLELGNRHIFSSIKLDYILVQCANFRSRNLPIDPVSEASNYPFHWLTYNHLHPGVLWACSYNSPTSWSWELLHFLLPFLLESRPATILHPISNQSKKSSNSLCFLEFPLIPHGILFCFPIESQV